MVDIKSLLPELRKLVGELAEDLLARSTSDATINAGLKEAFQQIEKGGRTAQTFEVWREDYLDQVAVAWVLACVFVRFMENNGLIDECWLAGEGERRRLADDTHTLFFREHAHDTDREYFQHVFKEVGKIPAAKDLFAEGKTPLWAVAPSGDAAMKLLKFWREMDAETGHLKRSFHVESGDTRFLGDLYQELSERAKKKFALLQTPVFVEEFILDRTLTPALAEFGLEKVRMIDPTCGSGHFLLGGFARLFDLWSKPDHTTGNTEKDAQKALDGVWGVDVNPFAVAIARFRLIVAALQGCGIKRLKHAPAWNIHLATGDSLLFGSRWDREGNKKAEQQFLDTDEESWAPEIYACEDKEAISEVLGQQYHVVVGNPPYITVKDRRLNDAYRKRYSTCHQKYSLAVPFAERFFDLAVVTSGQLSGFVGQITANSFMKREFGKRLIEEFFPTIDLTHVIDTSGAHIPGHGTPTVILLGRNRTPQNNEFRVVFGIRGEPTALIDPSEGQVWRSIVMNVDRAGTEDSFTITSDIQRSAFSMHPWSMAGGQAFELMEHLDACESTLSNFSQSIGFMAITGEDDAFVAPRYVFKRAEVPYRQLVTGDLVRDWCQGANDSIAFPYKATTDTVTCYSEEEAPELLKFFWPVRTLLRKRSMFGKTPEEHGKPWYGYMQLIRERVCAPLSIPFALVATHNHFILDRGGSVFTPSVPVVTVGDTTSSETACGVLGVLNSSIACFWMQKTFHNKGGPGGASSKDEKWHDFYEFAGRALASCPIPPALPCTRSTELVALANEYTICSPASVCRSSVAPTKEQLLEASDRAQSLRKRMITLQEELDWECYRSYGVLTESLVYDGDDRPEIELGQRAFEIVLARRISEKRLQTMWFEWLRIHPCTDIPTSWPKAYRSIVARRIEAIESNQMIATIEDPSCKRRWEGNPWHDVQREIKNWLLDRLEDCRYWPTNGIEDVSLQSVSSLADKASSDIEFLKAAELFRGRADFDVNVLVAELIQSESVPALPNLCYKKSGLQKRIVWERVWQQQRREDNDDSFRCNEVPPKYKAADFQKVEFFRLRGKLDVPKERWISYPHCQTESDPSLVVGWAGWNHLQRATALVAYYDARKREGWDAKRLTPLLAGLDQLLPWIHQWHAEIDAEFGETAGQSFQTMLEHDSHELGLTLDDVRNWTPPAKAKATKQPRKARSTRKKGVATEEDEE